MELLSETAEDQKAAHATCFRKGKNVEQEKFQSLRKSSIFDTTSKRGSRKGSSQSEAWPNSIESMLHGTNAAYSKDMMISHLEQEDGREKRRIRLASNGSKLAIANTPVSTKVKEEQPLVSSLLAALMAGYESECD